MRYLERVRKLDERVKVTQNNAFFERWELGDKKHLLCEFLHSRMESVSVSTTKHVLYLRHQR